MTLAKINQGDIFDSIDTFFKDFPVATKNPNFMPRVEITEDRDNFYLNLEMPGIKKEDIKINIENNVLTIKGTKSQSYNKEENNLVMNERYYGEFSRSFNLSKDIKIENIDAQYNDGVLNLMLPKVEEAKPVVKEIAVK